MSISHPFYFQTFASDLLVSSPHSDARGSLVQSIAVNGEQTVTFNLTHQPNGLYFVSLLGQSTTTELLPFIIQH